MPAKSLSFRIGDVFKPDDDLSIWFCTIALAYNDLITTHRRVGEVETEGERFYYWRLGIGHYSEIMLFLGRMRDSPAIKAFIDSSPRDLQQAYERALELYEQHRTIAKHVRNEAAFHYPKWKGLKRMRRVLYERDLQDERGGITSTTGKVGDTRMHFADEVMARMFWNAMGATQEKAEEAYAALGEGIAAFMRFANPAQDEFFMRQPEGTVEFRTENS